MMLRRLSCVARGLVPLAALALLLPLNCFPQTDSSEPIKVGIIGLDTSHVIAFTKSFNDPTDKDYVPGLRVVAAYKGGSPDVESSWSRVDKFAAELRDKWKIEIVNDIPTLCSKVDAVLLESVDGRPHLEQVKPVFAAHKPVFIDKPLAGSYKDAKEIAELGKAAGVPWFTASSLRFWEETQRLKNPVGIGHVLAFDVLGPTSREPHVPSLFWYGVHAIEMLYQLMGPGCESVTMQISGNQDVVVGKWKDGRLGVMRGFSSGLYAYSITVYGDKGVLHSEDKPETYTPMLVAIAKFFRTGVPPIDPNESLETLAFMEAADLSQARGGVAVPLSEIMNPSGNGHLAARIYDSGFELAHDSYNGISSASDGNIYYVLSSQDIDVGAQIFSFDPATEKIRHLGDLTEVCGEKGLKAIPQNKSHVRFWEANGKLYFASHIGYYTIKNGMETVGVPPPGYKPYPGGHFLSYDMATGKFENLAIAPRGEGIISMTMDPARGRLYGLTWPTGHFIRFDLATKELKDLGLHSGLGESVRGPQYRTICRSLVVDPRDGSVYFTTSEGSILRYRYDRDAVEKVEGEDLRKDYFGSYDPTSSGNMGYNWRQATWYAPENVIYGVHGNSGYLFRFDPRLPRVEVLERLTSLPSQRSGMNDQFSYGYLGFILGPDGKTLYYLTGGPIFRGGKRVAGKSIAEKGESKGEEDLHLITYYLPAGKYIDHGAIFFPDGQRPKEVNSIAVGKDGSVYALAAVTQNGHGRTDLMRIPGPIASQ